jgi:hypothetical protein
MVLCDTKLICECFVPGYIAMYATLASRDVVRHFLFGFLLDIPNYFFFFVIPFFYDIQQFTSRIVPRSQRVDIM